RSSTRVDLSVRAGTLGPAVPIGCVLVTPDSAWTPLPDRPELRIEGGLDNGYAIFCVPAEEVTASQELWLEVSGSLEPGIQVEFYDTVLGYIGLGPIEPAGAGELRTVA